MESDFMHSKIGAEYSAIHTVQTEGMYLSVFDKNSSVNVAGVWDKEWEQAKQSAGEDNWKQLLYFNGGWAKFADARQALTWVLDADGVYSVQMVLSSTGTTIPFDGKKEEFVTTATTPQLLWCPSGELVVASPSKFGQLDLESMYSVPVGLYRTELVLNEQQYGLHQYLENISDYPINDGPDWVIYLSRQSNVE